MHSDAMTFFWLKVKWVKSHGTAQFRVINDGCDLLKETVAEWSTVEKGEANVGGKGNLHLIELGHTNLAFNETYHKHGKAPRRIYLPHDLTSYKVSK